MKQSNFIITIFLLLYMGASYSIDKDEVKSLLSVLSSDNWKGEKFEYKRIEEERIDVFTKYYIGSEDKDLKKKKTFRATLLQLPKSKSRDKNKKVDTDDPAPTYTYINGFKITKEFNKDDSDGSVLIVLIDKRCMLTFSFQNMKMKDVITTSKRFDWDELKLACD